MTSSTGDFKDTSNEFAGRCSLFSNSSSVRVTSLMTVEALIGLLVRAWEEGRNGLARLGYCTLNPSCAISSDSMATSLPLALKSGPIHFTGNGRTRFQLLIGSPFSLCKVIATFGGVAGFGSGTISEGRLFLLKLPVATSICQFISSFDFDTPRLSVMF